MVDILARWQLLSLKVILWKDLMNSVGKTRCNLNYLIRIHGNIANSFQNMVIVKICTILTIYWQFLVKKKEKKKVIA